MFAVESKSNYVFKIVDLLLKYNAAIADHNHEGSTPLMLAAQSDSIDAPEIVRLLLKIQASVMDQDEDGMTPLMYAMLSESVRADKIVTHLLKNGASVLDRDSEDKTPLMHAVNSSSPRAPQIIQMLLQHHASVNDRDKGGLIPFVHALMSDSPKSPEIVRMVWQNDVSVNEFNLSGRTILECASMSHSPSALEVIKILLQKGAQVNKRNSSNLTVLMSILSIENPNIPGIVRLLLKNGASLNDRDDIGMTPLMYAVTQEWSNAAETVKVLLEHQASVTDCDERGMTPLLYAASSCPDSTAEIVEILLQHGASITDRDFTYVTAIMHAAKSSSDNAEPTLRALLHQASLQGKDNGTSVAYALDKDGMSALDHFFINTDFHSTTLDISSPKFNRMLNLLLPYESELSLALAATYYTTDVLKLLLEQYPNKVNSALKESESLLHCAIQCKSFSKCTLVMSYSPLLHFHWKGLSPLELAIVYDCKPFILEMISAQMSDKDIIYSINKCINKDETIFNFLERLPVKRWRDLMKNKLMKDKNRAMLHFQTSNHVCQGGVTWPNLRSNCSLKMRLTTKTENDQCKCAVLTVTNCQTLLHTHQEEVEDVKLCVMKLLEYITMEFQSIAPHMEFQCILSGSMGEQTRCYAPDEMDIICLFINCGGLRLFFTERQIRVDDSERWRTLCSVKNYLDPRKVAQAFYDFVTLALYSILDKNITFGKLSVSQYSLQRMDKISRLKLLWKGQAFPNLTICVDLVPAFSCICDIPLPLSVECREFLILAKVSRHNHQPSDYFQQSYCRAEKQVMNNLPEHITEGYIVAKAVRIAAISGQSLNTDTLGIVEDINVDDFITSYVLKTCLFNVLNKLHAESNCERNVDLDNMNSEYVPIQDCKYAWADAIYAELERALIDRVLKLWHSESDSLLFCQQCTSPRACCRKTAVMLAFTQEIRRWLKQHMNELREK